MQRTRADVDPDLAARVCSLTLLALNSPRRQVTDTFTSGQHAYGGNDAVFIEQAATGGTPAKRKLT
jgi:hypothetical protein